MGGGGISSVSKDFLGSDPKVDTTRGVMYIFFTPM